MKPQSYSESSFPKSAISPLQLKNGSFGRFAIYVNDHDGNGRKGGRVGTVDLDFEPYSNPR